ncbi:MAG: protein kinase [Oscillospiraceae bacterium]|nr:protein kinase [Oscillospiraceae bacterium]
MEQNRCPGCMEIKSGTVCGHCGYDEGRQNAPHQLQIGSVLLGKYLVGRALGQGGFGITYLGWNRYLETKVAIKEYFPSVFVERNATRNTTVVCRTEQLEEYYAENRMRFLREAKTLAKLQSVPQIVSILDFFEMNNTAYIVMEYLQGSDLRAYVRDKGGRLSPEETFRILRPAMAALAKVHEADLVHRDISPDNIMLLRDGSVKLMDFGAVRNVNNPGVDKELTQATQAIVKHGFAPIEQYSATGSIGPWTDEYALCATMYYCMTGKVPGNAPDRVMDGTDLPWETVAGLTPRQRQILCKGSAVRAKDRYASIRELMSALFDQSVTDEPPHIPVAPVKPAPAPQPIASTVNLSPLMKRAFLFLEDGEWDRADDYCEQTLNNDPECAEAYLGKLMVALRVRRREELRDCAEPFDSHGHYQKAMRFASPQLQSELTGYIRHIKERNETARLDAVYQDVLKKMESAKTEKDYKNAAKLFASIEGYLDADALAQQCRDKAEHIRKDTIYKDVKKLMVSSQIANYQEAIKRLETIADWKDSAELIEICKETITKLKEAEECRKQEEAIRAKRNKKIATVVFSSIAVCVAIIFLWTSVLFPMIRYNKAEKLFESGSYDEAITIFTELGDYRDAAQRIPEVKYAKADTLLEGGFFDQAIEAFGALGNYEDSPDRVKEAKYAKAGALAEQGSYREAAVIYNVLGSYKDSPDRYFECVLKYAEDLVARKDFAGAEEQLQILEKQGVYAENCSALYTQMVDGYFAEGNYLEAMSAYKHTKDYQEGSEAYKELSYRAATGLFGQKKYDAAKAIFLKIPGYLDADRQALESGYQYGLQCFSEKKYKLAVYAFEELGDYKDSKTQVLESKYQYVKSNRNRSDGNTHNYLKDLKAVNYKDSGEIYKELYKWSAKLVYANTNKNDEKTIVASVGKNLSYFHVGFELSGGAPGEVATFYLITKYPEGYTHRDSWDWEDCKAGDWVGVYWGDGLSTCSGTLVLEVYKKGTNELLGKFEFKVK